MLRLSFFMVFTFNMQIILDVAKNIITLTLMILILSYGEEEEKRDRVYGQIYSYNLRNITINDSIIFK